MTRQEIYQYTRKALESGGVENAPFDAAQLLQSVGIERLALLSEPQTAVPDDVFYELCEKINRRISGEPLQYIIGEWEFYGLPFKVGRGVLIPRQDTETLVETAERFLKERAETSRRTLDLCAGTGCIGIALAKTARADVTCIECSPDAFGYLKENITLNSVRVNAVLGDVLDFDNLSNLGEYDVIVSNPPYLTESDLSEISREVAHEPKLALFGGTDGLDFYRKLLGFYPRILKKGGMFAVEIGISQEKAVSEIFRENGLSPQAKKDLCGVYRVIYAVK